MEIIDTIVAKGAAGKGDGLEEAIAQIEKIGRINYKFSPNHLFHNLNQLADFLFYQTIHIVCCFLILV